MNGVGSASGHTGADTAGPREPVTLVTVQGTGAGHYDHAGSRWWQRDAPFQNAEGVISFAEEWQLVFQGQRS